MKIFYSWQSDLPNASNRGFIEKALENVAKALRNDRTLNIEPSIDRDTAGVSGSPEIVSTIFSKIEQADIFISDISIINGADSARPSPNPNVLVETGYALKALGDKRVIMIFNTAFGTVEKLPFDLRARRILQYNMPATSDDRSAERKKLETLVEQAVRSIRPRLSLSHDYTKAFENESARVKELAYEQPDLWEYLLMIELLKPKIKRVREEYDEVINGLRYRRATKASNKAYFNLIQERMIDLEKILGVLETILNKEIISSWGPPGVSGNALEIKKATDRLISICEAIVEWESEISSVHPPEIFENLKSILQGTTARMLAETERLVNEMSKVFQQPNPTGVYEINLTLNLPEGWAEKAQAEIRRISRWIQENPYEWNNE
jgi:hypothetical protein